MAAFRIFSPKAFTLALTHDKADDNSDVEGEADEDFGQDYGQAEIKILCDRFGYDQDVDSLIKEWDERTDFGLNHADCHWNEGPTLKEFPFEDAVKLWADKKNRCIII